MSHITRGYHLGVACAALLAGGCVSINETLNEYAGVPVKDVKTSIDTFRVFDRPADHRLMITPSLASAFKNGSTLTDSANDTQWRKVFEEGVYAYFRQSGRSCEIVDGHVLMQAQWQFTYRCEITTSSVNSTDKP